MILPVAYYGEAVLRQKAVPIQEITDEIRTLVKDMYETMVANDGMGLAAPQVYKSIRLFITCMDVQQPDGKWVAGELEVFINPKISQPGLEMDQMAEGCLSIPKIRGEVVRPITLFVEYMDLSGQTHARHVSGLEARLIMHENDHLNGVLYVDRMDPKERQLLDPTLRKIKKSLRK
jgi:peptide deformylase